LDDVQGHLGFTVGDATNGFEEYAKALATEKHNIWKRAKGR
jgi:hypothetical protein